MVKPVVRDDIDDEVAQNATEFLIKVRYNSRKDVKNVDYHFQ